MRNLVLSQAPSEVLCWRADLYIAHHSYGLVGIAIVNVFLALSLGELASAYPSAGGQVCLSSR